MPFSLYALLERAKTDPTLRGRLLACRAEEDPADAFCKVCAAYGAEISLGDLFASGEEFCANLHKSVNGGATVPIEGWSDELGLIFASLEGLENRG